MLILTMSVFVLTLLIPVMLGHFMKGVISDILKLTDLFVINILWIIISMIFALIVISFLTRKLTWHQNTNNNYLIAIDLAEEFLKTNPVYQPQLNQVVIDTRLSKNPKNLNALIAVCAEIEALKKKEKQLKKKQLEIPGDLKIIDKKINNLITSFKNSIAKTIS